MDFGGNGGGFGGFGDFFGGGGGFGDFFGGGGGFGDFFGGGGFNPPDPDKIKDGLKQAFNVAASKENSAQPLFIELNDKFTALSLVDQENLSMNSLKTLGDFLGAYVNVVKAAKTDSDAAQTFAALQEDMQAAMKNATMDGPYTPGKPDDGFFPSQKEDKQAPKKAPKPKKPGKGDFNL